MYVNGHIPRPPRKWYQFMLDIAWPELMVIGIVAVVAIGPKDLPKVMNSMGKWAGKARALAQDVQRTFDQLNYEARIADQLAQKPDAAAKPAPHHGHGSHGHAKPQPPAAPSDDPHDHLGST